MSPAHSAAKQLLLTVQDYRIPTGKAACRLTLSILLLFAFYGIYVAPTFRDFVTFLCLANEWPYRKKKKEKKKEKKERKKGIRKFRIP